MTTVHERYALDGLRASRKADRIKIAAALEAIAWHHGAETSAEDSPPNKGLCGASIGIRITLKGVGALISIDDLHERHGSQGGLVHWYNAVHPARKFTHTFNGAVGDYGQYKAHHKATSIGSWARIAGFVDRGLALAAADDAFLPGEN